MQRQFLAGVALVAMMAGSAFAADMPLKAVAPVALYDWSGTYIGGVIGGAWGTNDISDPGLGVVGTLLGVPVIQIDQPQRLHRRHRGRLAVSVRQARRRLGSRHHLGQSQRHQHHDLHRPDRRHPAHLPQHHHGHQVGGNRGEHDGHRAQQLAALRQGGRRLRERQLHRQLGDRRHSRCSAAPAATTGPAGRSAPASSGRSIRTGRSRPSTTTWTSAPRTSRSTARLSGASASHRASRTTTTSTSSRPA